MRAEGSSRRQQLGSHSGDTPVCGFQPLGRPMLLGPHWTAAPSSRWVRKSCSDLTLPPKGLSPLVTCSYSLSLSLNPCDFWLGQPRTRVVEEAGFV